MNSYFITNLTSSSLLEDRRRLHGALMATPGVSVVTLSPSRGEISITFRKNTPIELDVLARVIKSAGFTLGERSGRWSGGPNAQ